MKKIIFCLVVLASFAFGSAGIIEGTTQSIAIDSEPTDGQLRGVTPLSVMMDKTLSSHEIRLQKDGFTDINVPMTQAFDPVTIVNIFWGFTTTDLIGGNVMEYAPNNYYFNLQKK